MHPKPTCLPKRKLGKGREERRGTERKGEGEEEQEEEEYTSKTLIEHS